MSIDHSSAVAGPKPDPVFLHVKAGMTAIVTDTDANSGWRMADAIGVDGGTRNAKIPTWIQVADVDTGVINWIKADLVTHIVPRAGSRAQFPRNPASMQIKSFGSWS